MIIRVREGKVSITESSGNVFADLGLPNAEETLAKVQLAIAIDRIMEERELTERETAQILGSSRSRIHNVRRGHLTGVSADWLFHALNKLGHDVEINVKPKP